MSDKTTGLFDKYRVERTDGKGMGWAFVLEDKDPLAIPALQAYSEAADRHGYTKLAGDLRDVMLRMRVAHSTTPGADDIEVDEVVFDLHRCGKPDADPREELS